MERVTKESISSRSLAEIIAYVYYVPCGNKLIPVGEDSLAGGAGEEPGASHVLDENATHFHQWLFFFTNVLPPLLFA